jgi:hypothetical protein
MAGGSTGFPRPATRHERYEALDRVLDALGGGIRPDEVPKAGSTGRVDDLAIAAAELRIALAATPSPTAQARHLAMIDRAAAQLRARSSGGGNDSRHAGRHPTSAPTGPTLFSLHPSHSAAGPPATWRRS